ncbi:MAG: type II secretion system F family protein [Planctomycetes bacterium]|nr:type II secretion system F family protein [Planctomycetota bacterium]
MTDFAYIARDRMGQRVNGRVSAGSQRDALALLDARALYPLEVTAEEAKAAKGKFKRVRPQLVATTYNQLSSLLRSGVPLLRSLELLRDQTSHSGLRFVLGEVSARVEDGATLAEALATFPQVFGEMALNMIRAGGEGSFLEEALERVAEFTENQQDLKGRTMGAIAYPMVLAVFGTGVVTVLLVFFVPLFEDLFSRLRERGELPMLTEWMLTLSASLRGWWGLVILLVIGSTGAYLSMALRTEQGRVLCDRVKLRLPIVGTIFRNMAVARFCRVLGTMLHNGVPIIRSLEVSAEATGNRVLQRAITEAAENVTAGESLAAPLSASGQFPSTVVEMIAVSEEAANMDSVLNDIADSLEKLTWRRLELFVRLLEPLMLLILAAAVLIAALALLLPMFKMTAVV